MALNGPHLWRDDDAQVKKRIRESLNDATKNYGKSTAFICTEDVERTWRSLDDIETVLFGLQDWTRTELENIQKDFVLTLSILFRINWLQNHDFRQIFYDYKSNGKRRDDEQLHYDKEELNFLEEYQDPFYEQQYIFKPAVLKESDNQPVHGRLRLPFTEEAQTLGSGGFGKVYKVKVAPGYFEKEDGSINKKASSRQERAFAIKRFHQTSQSEAEFKTEVTNVQLLKESLSKHEGVMLHAATIVHGNEFAILMPIAERWDLETFLYNGFNRDEGTRQEKAVYDFNEMFPSFRGHFKYQSVLWEMYTLADALDWLHNQLNVKSKPGLRCAHTDFKPSNILICSDKDEDYPAGRWVITDFGISAFEDDKLSEDEATEDVKRRICDKRDLDKDQEFKTVYDIGFALDQLAAKTQTIKVARSNEGTYQAPEARHSGHKHFVGRRSDIWSFGCVLLEVITFALGGVKFLDEFRNNRISAHKMDCFYAERKLSDIESWAFEFEPKREIQEWMFHLCTSYPSHSNWIRKCTTLIHSTLAMQPQNRPDANQLKRSLRETWIATKKVPLQTSLTAPPHNGKGTDRGDVQKQSPKRSFTSPLSRTVTSTESMGKVNVQKLGIHRIFVWKRHQKPPILSLNQSQENHDSGNNSRSVFGCEATRPIQGILHPTRRGTTGNMDSRRSVLPNLRNTSSSYSSVRHCALPGRERVLNLCQAPGSGQVAYLFPNQIRVFLVDGSLYRALDLDDGVNWRQIRMSESHIAAYGIRNRRKQVFLYDLNAGRRIGIPSHLPLDDIRQVVVSPKGAFGFLSKNSVRILEIENSQVFHFSIDEGYSIKNANFSADGSQLYVWATGLDHQVSNRCYFWPLNYPLTTGGSVVSRHRDYMTRNISMPQFSLLTPESGQFCVIEENAANFFIAEPDISEYGLPRQHSVTKLYDVACACIYGNQSLICVHKPKRNGLSREHPQVRKYNFGHTVDGSRCVQIDACEVAPLKTHQLDELTCLTVLREQRACALCFSNGDIEIIKMANLNTDVLEEI